MCKRHAGLSIPRHQMCLMKQAQARVCFVMLQTLHLILGVSPTQTVNIVLAQTVGGGAVGEMTPDPGVDVTVDLVEKWPSRVNEVMGTDQLLVDALRFEWGHVRMVTRFCDTTALTPRVHVPVRQL